jgi:uncharacterized membrane protein
MRVVSDRPGSEPAKRGFFKRWGKPLLVCSLALNLVTVGLIVGAGMRERRFMHGLAASRLAAPDGKAAAQLGSLAFVETMKPERRESLLAPVKERWEALKALRREVRAARTEFVKILDSEPFDSDRAKAKATRIIEAENSARSAFHALLIEIARGMTPDERSAFRRWRIEARHGGPGAPGGPPPR